MRPLILISNDDGYEAKGINALIDMVKDLGDVLVCAPEGSRSGMACAFSCTTPLTLTKRFPSCTASEGGHEEVAVWSCSGTPVDAVKLALAELCPRRPDLVIGGINHGDNASVNTHYSGTMGVTLEGCMKYITSVAFSLCDNRADADFESLRPYVRDMVQRLLKDGLPKGVCLNVNFPKSGQEGYRGVKVCRMSRGTWGSEVTRCHHPRGYDYWWMVGHYQNDEPEAEDTDRWALDHGYVAITPTRVDVTDYDTVDRLKDWNQ